MASSSLNFLKMMFFLLFISPSFSSPTASSLGNLQAENLIRGLNLFPKDSINTPENDPHIVHGNIVEKKFTFPGFSHSGLSVEELGHHAGYYRLPNSKAAR